MRSLPIVFLALCLGSAGHAATLRTTTTLHASTVRLSDLFDDAGTQADRVLGPGPGPGGRIVVEAPQLRAIARQFHVDWQPGSAADRAVLDWPGRPLPREIAMDAVRTALTAAGASADCDIALAGFTPPLVPVDGEPRAIVSDLAYDAGAGRFTAALSIVDATMEPVNMRITGQADDTVEVPVATARLVAGSVLRDEDVHMARVRSSLLRNEVARRVGDAVGLQLKHSLLAGQPFAMGELVRPATVAKGAVVTMLLDSPGIALSAQGQALEAGAIGERIRVLNPVSRAVIEAEVIGTDRVRVAPNAMPMSIAGRATTVSVR
jgi:flagella basal body P-ring formation protein FlgA